MITTYIDRNVFYAVNYSYYKSYSHKHCDIGVHITFMLFTDFKI